MQYHSRPVDSHQNEVHRQLLKVLARHLRTEYKKPISEYSQSLFANAERLRRRLKKPIILDSGCGTGSATRLVAKQNTDALVIGIDKSSHRLSRGGMNSDVEHGDNCLLLRMNLVDFWRLAVQHGWQLKKHYLLYPNPWPLPRHLRRRWYAHPVFPQLLKLGGKLELRCNWRIYAEEFHAAMNYVAPGSCNLNEYVPTSCLSLFEKNTRPAVTGSTGVVLHWILWMQTTKILVVFNQFPHPQSVTEMCQTLTQPHKQLIFKNMQSSYSLCSKLAC